MFLLSLVPYLKEIHPDDKILVQSQFLQVMQKYTIANLSNESYESNDQMDVTSSIKSDNRTMTMSDQDSSYYVTIFEDSQNSFECYEEKYNINTNE